jgi:hypothetical protein
MTGMIQLWRTRHPLFPTSRLGWWSVWTFGMLVAGFAVMLTMAILGETGGETFRDNLALSIPAAVAFAGATVSIGSGIVAAVRSHERSVAAGVAAAASTVVFLFVNLSLLLG